MQPRWWRRRPPGAQQQASETPESWFASGQQALQDALALAATSARARNVILFVGDGMGMSTVTAARILEGQLRGQSGEENLLAFETMPYVALSKTVLGQSADGRISRHDDRDDHGGQNEQ